MSSAAQLHHGESLRAKVYFLEAFQELARRTDVMFLWLLAAEWVGLIAAAILTAPLVWNGTHSSMHPHVWLALLSGPAFILPAIATALLYPATGLSRHTIAVAQMLVSTVLTDVTGGRIESHFHIFGSLAFLAIYRDWRVLGTASLVTVLDHLVRGTLWPQSVYGVVMISPWRLAEHSWWVCFEDFFLILSANQGIGDMWAMAVSRARLQDAAVHDALTGLGNRRFLQQEFELKPGSEKRKKAALIFINLDRFRHANEKLGPAGADELLRQVANRFTLAVGIAGTLVRIDGDHFAVLTNDLTAEAAEDLSLQILSCIETPFETDDKPVLLSASMGISLYPEHGADVESLLDRAGRATNAARTNGSNQCVLFSAEVARREMIRQQIRRDLCRAGGRKQFRLHYQPILGRDEQLLGFEALLRWTHPVHGTIEPADFIQMAEESGIISEIGEWVLGEACRECQSWQTENGTCVGVAVNVSPRQFEDPEFTERVLNIVRESGLHPSLLTLELTETVLVKDMPRARRILTRLRECGILVALDDFGTGYSSLSYLTALPADTVKLDRSFLGRESPEAVMVVEAIIQMSHRLGLRVVAEGVETQEQSERLRNLNCDEQQGFWFSRPLEPAEMKAYLQERRTEVGAEAEFASR